MLTTITSYWNRPEMLEVWLAAMRKSTAPGVEHLLFFVGEDQPPAVSDPPKGLRVVQIKKTEPFSIGHVHNMGAHLADTEWIMKIDIDTIPTLMFFNELICLLKGAGPREWFNIGMLYIKRHFSAGLLGADRMPLGPAFLNMICANLRHYSQSAYALPAGTNFVCRTQDYLDLGGCDPAFNGYGWEDYQQIYMLEKYQKQADPLPGALGLHNVTTRCRDEISRTKAREVFELSQTFCLLHRWHPPVVKQPPALLRNRHVLLDWICRARS
jgi:hypothetical protein